MCKPQLWFFKALLNQRKWKYKPWVISKSFKSIRVFTNLCTIFNNSFKIRFQHWLCWTCCRQNYTFYAKYFLLSPHERKLKNEELIRASHIHTQWIAKQLRHLNACGRLQIWIKQLFLVTFQADRIEPMSFSLMSRTDY